MLTGKEEIMMFMQQCPVQSDQGLPLIIVELRVFGR